MRPLAVVERPTSVVRLDSGVVEYRLERRGDEAVVIPETRVGQPALIIASRNDGTVPFAHATALASAIEKACLVESRADTHLIWFGPDWPDVARTIDTFLAADPASTDGPPLSL